MTGTLTVSPLRRKRGWPSRTITFLAHDDTIDGALPALESAVMTRAVARHVVSESGKVSVTRAWPLESVWMAG